VNRRSFTIRGEGKVPTRLSVDYRGRIAKGRLWLEHNGVKVPSSVRANASELEALLVGVWLSPEAVGPWVVRVRSRGGSVSELRLSVNVVTA
jgi:hypothetical protein